jgi:hypothetical protein
MTDESEIIEAVADEPTIWGQKSDVDWWGRTSVSDYDAMLAEDGGICGDCGANITEEDIEGLEDLDLE